MKKLIPPFTLRVLNFRSYSVVYFDFQIPSTEHEYRTERVSYNESSKEYKNKWLVIENGSASECDWYAMEYTDWEIIMVNAEFCNR